MSPSPLAEFYVPSGAWKSIRLLYFPNFVLNVTFPIFLVNTLYEHHIKSILNKVNKTIGLLHKFQLILPRHSLITIYKTFIRPHLDYGDVIYDRAFNESFHQRLESIQYNAAIAITGITRGTSSGKLLQELGLETSKSRR